MALYVWGAAGMLGIVQISLGNEVIGWLLGAVSFIALIVGLSNTKE
jgi:hypothetical protein